MILTHFILTFSVFFSLFIILKVKCQIHFFFRLAFEHSIPEESLRHILNCYDYFMMLSKFENDYILVSNHLDFTA